LCIKNIYLPKRRAGEGCVFYLKASAIAVNAEKTPPQSSSLGAGAPFCRGSKTSMELSGVGNASGFLGLGEAFLWSCGWGVTVTVLLRSALALPVAEGLE
jgi:hypothetical protein